MYTSHAGEQMANSQKSNDLEMSRSRSNISRTRKISKWAITFEPEVVQTSGWLKNVPYKTALLHATVSFDVRRHVFASRDFKENEKNIKNAFLQIVKVKGQTQGQGQIKVKGQGHLEIFTILYVIDVIWLIYEKWKSASKIVNIQSILPKIDTHNAWTYPMECAKQLD